MCTERSLASEPPPRSPFNAGQAAIWFAAAVVLGVAAARVAVWAEHVRAPLVLFPLLVGGGLGLACWR